MAIAPYAITALSLTAETFRQAPSSFIAGTGVVGTGDYQVTANGSPNMSINVAAGQAWVPGTLASTTGFPANLNAQTAYGLPSVFNEQGSIYGWLNGTVNLAISAADPTNPRIDIVCVSVQDAQYSGSNNQMVTQVITGTPAPSPSPPNAPAASLVLAQVAVAANATSIVSGNITDERKFLALTAPERDNPKGRLYQGAAQTLPTGGFTQVNLGVVDGLRGGMAAVSSNSTLQVPIAGDYLVCGELQFSTPASSSSLGVAIFKNGTQARYGTQQNGVTVAGTAYVVADVVTCSAGDLLTLYGFVQGGNTALNATGATTQNYLSASLVSQ